VAYGTTRGIPAFTYRAMRDYQRRGHLVDHVIPIDALSYTLLSSGMCRHMGDRSTPSYALSHVHIAFINQALDHAYIDANTDAAKLFAYLEWLRGGEVFVLVTQPSTDICANLLPETKSDKTCVADIVIAFKTLSGLCFWRWLQRLLKYSAEGTIRVFSASNHPRWSSALFRKRFTVPSLDQMRGGGEPTLQIFSAEPGHRICDAVYSHNSWRRAGRSRVSMAARPDEPKPRFTRKTSPYGSG
jgi:hypothetical protein